jgi:thiol:disulfide interchange protein DsbD
MVLAAASTWGLAAQAGHLKVELISDTDSVQPGRPLRVGLRFELEPHWHIYWRNPGDSGEPPEVRWQLPPGFRAGEVQWPAPERLGSGSVIDFGYQGSVLLPVEIRPPGAPLAAGGTLTISAEVSWLVCKDSCVPGKADLTLTLPVRSAPGPASKAHALFRAADASLPGPLPPGWTAEASPEQDSFVLTVRGAGRAQASFFPLAADQIDNAAPQAATPLPDGLRLTLRKSEQLTATPARLEGILELGPGRAYAVSAPVRSRPERAAPSQGGPIQGD